MPRDHSNEMVMQPVIAMEIEGRASPLQSHSAVDDPSQGFLPKIESTRMSQSLVNQKEEFSDSDTSTTNVDQMRRANKRAIHMIMKNMKK